MDETSFTPIGPMPAVAAEIPRLADMEPNFGEYVGAQFSSSLRDNGYAAGMQGIIELNEANRTRPRTGFGPLHPSSDPIFNPPPPEKTMSAEDVGLLAAEQGVSLPNLGDARYTLDAATIMLDRAKRRQVNDQTIAAYDPSWGTAAAVSLMAGLADPLNIASAFIPFVGEARYAELLAGATGMMGRTAVRGAVGAVEGAGGALLLEPILIEAATQEGRDYQLADGMRNLLFGAAFGSGLHMSLGGIGDVAFKRRFTTIDPITDPVDLVNRLPVEVNQAAVSAAISDLVHGRPVQAAEVVDGFVRTNPDLAEAVSYAATLRRDGPELDDIPGRITYWEEQLELMKSPPKKAVTFLSWLKSKGGIRDLDNDIRDRVGDTAHLGKAYISQKGAAKTERGMLFDDLFAEAKAEGFVETREEFRSLFEKDAVGIKRSDAEAAKAHADRAAHVERMIIEAGVSPKTKNAIKARAIAGREQHIVASERARLRAAFERLEARQDDYKTIAEGGKAEVTREFEPPKSEAPKAGETIEKGDEVLTLDDKGQPNLDAPLKVDRVINDPLYGTYVYFEGVSAGYSAKQLQVVKKAVPEAQASPEPQAPKPTQPVDDKGKPRPYTFDEVAVAIAEAKAMTRGGPVSFEALEERLPGLTKSTMKRVAMELIKSEDVANVGKTEDGSLFVITFARRETDDELTIRKGSAANKIEQARVNLDALYPRMAAERTYYLSSIFPGQMNQLEMKDTSAAKALNDMIEKKKLRAFDEESGAELTVLDSAYFNIDTRGDMPGVLLVFADTAKPISRKPTPESRLPKVKSEAPAPTTAAPERQPMPPGTEVRVDTPPAPKEALTSAEIDAATAQTRQVQEVTLRRIESMMGQLPPEIAEGLRAQLAKIDGDAAELEKVMNSAVSCLLNPK